MCSIFKASFLSAHVFSSRLWTNRHSGKNRFDLTLSRGQTDESSIYGRDANHCHWQAKSLPYSESLVILGHENVGVHGKSAQSCQYPGVIRRIVSYRVAQVKGFVSYIQLGDGDCRGAGAASGVVIGRGLYRCGRENEAVQRRKKKCISVHRRPFQLSICQQRGRPLSPASLPIINISRACAKRILHTPRVSRTLGLPEGGFGAKLLCGRLHG